MSRVGSAGVNCASRLLNQTRIHAASLRSPAEFWAEQARKLVHWDIPFKEAITPIQLRSSKDDAVYDWYKWFEGGYLNTCYEAVDRHVDEGRGDATALIYDSPASHPSSPAVSSFTFSELQTEVSRFAGVLQQQGVITGDTVLLYMPMVPEAIITMLACARLGCIHSVVFGGFAAPEVAKRIDDAKAKAVVTASFGIERDRLIPYTPLLNEALDLAAHKPDLCIVLDRPETEHLGRIEPVLKNNRRHTQQLDWCRLREEAARDRISAECISVPSSHPLYTTYTSGTTGKPKGIVRDNGGHVVALKWAMKSVFNMDVGDVMFAASDIGWTVGHTLSTYGPLFRGCSTVLFEGKPVDPSKPGIADMMWRVAAQHSVKSMFMAPTALRAMKKEDPAAQQALKHDLEALESVFVAGERCDPDTLEWTSRLLPEKVVVSDHWWQTETGWPVTATCLGFGKEEQQEQPIIVRFGSAGHPVPGYDVQVLDADEDGIGDVALKLPLPPGTLTGLWHNTDGMIDAYLRARPGFYATGDAGLIDKDGFVHIMSRTDDVINVSGHRLTTGSIEAAIATHEYVAESAVIAIPHDIKGEVPLGFIVLKSGVEASEHEVVSDLIALVRREIGAFACFSQAIVVGRLPKTRSGKTLRKSLRQLARGESMQVPATIDDPDILSEVLADLEEHGFAKKKHNH